MNWVPPNSLVLKVKWRPWGQLIVEGKKREEIRRNSEWFRRRVEGKE